MKNRKIASILLALTICIQNTACMQVKNGGNEISSSVVASSFDNTSEVLEDKDDEEDITKTLQFFLDELSKVKGIEDKIEFSNEEIENYLNTDDAIKCTDKTKWDFETLFAKIEENSNQYALDHPEVHSVFDLYYVVSVADLYDQAGIKCDYTYGRFGWKDHDAIHNAKIIKVKGGYMIGLPEPVEFK